MVAGEAPLHRSRKQIYFLFRRQRRERLRVVQFQTRQSARVQFLLGPSPTEMERQNSFQGPEGLRQPTHRDPHPLLHTRSRRGVFAASLRRHGRNADAGAPAVDRLAGQRKILDLFFLRQRRYSEGETAGVAGRRISHRALERAAGGLVRQQRLGRADESGAASGRCEGLRQLAPVEGRPARLSENRQHPEQLGRVAADRYPERHGTRGAAPQRRRQISDVRSAGVHGDEADLRSARPRAGGAQKIIWERLWLERMRRCISGPILTTRGSAPPALPFTGAITSRTCARSSWGAGTSVTAMRRKDWSA